MSELLSSEENAVLNHLADAWNAYIELSRLHPDDLSEFQAAIHGAQQIVMCRPVMAERFKFKIKINGDEHTVHDWRLSYERLCELADEDLKHNPSAMYRGKQKEGGLSSGDSIILEEGMIFDVMVTDNA